MEGSRSELVESAAEWGIPEDALPEEDHDGGVWPENEAAVRAYLAVSSQWRTTSLGEAGVHWLGLDYTAVRAGFRLAAVKMAPDLWDQVRLVEAGARDALNGIEDFGT